MPTHTATPSLDRVENVLPTQTLPGLVYGLLLIRLEHVFIVLLVVPSEAAPPPTSVKASQFLAVSWREIYMISMQSHHRQLLQMAT